MEEEAYPWRLPVNTKTKRTLDQVFQHPMTHDLEWRDVRSLFETMGEVDQEHNGNLKLTVDGQSIVFPMHNDMGVASADQVNQIRHLLRDRKKGDHSETETHFLVVIDHQEARIFHTEVKGSVPEVIKPYDPSGNKGHVHSGHKDTSETQRPDLNAYFEAVATNLDGAEKVLLFGAGKGASSAMDQFVAWLGTNRPQISGCLVGAVVVDESHLSEGQLLAKAREIYAR